MAAAGVAALGGLLLVLALVTGRDAASAASTSYRAQVLLDDPVGYWRLGETTGPTAVDETVNNSVGTYFDGVTLGLPGGLPADSDTAARFNGVDGRVVVPDPPSGALDFGENDFTLEAWIRTSASGNQRVLTKSAPDEPNWRLLVTKDPGRIGRLRASIFDGTVTRTAYSAVRMNDGRWHHIVVTFDRGVEGLGTTVYVDTIGRTTGGAAPGDISNSAPLRVASGGTPFFNGDIDEVALYDKVLPAGRIQAHYAAASDTVAPAVSLSAPPVGVPVNDSTPTFAGTAGAAPGDSETVTVEVYRGGEASGTPLETLVAQRSGDGSFSVDASPALTEGTYTVRAEQQDLAGNTGQSGPRTFAVSVTTYRDQVMADSPGGYWRLGEASGANAADETGNTSGTYRGGVALGQPGAVAFDPNSAAGFDGVNDTVKVPDAPSLSPTTGLTIEAWVSRTNAVQSTIVRKELQYLLRISAGGAVVCRLQKGGSDQQLSTPPNLIGTNGWHHVACAWDGVAMIIYVDGVARETLGVASPIDSGDSDLFVGSTNNSYDWFSGRIDEVAVYGRALSASRVLDHYQKANPNDGTPPTVLLMAPASGSPADALPNFGGRAGTQAGDSSTVTVKIYEGSSASGTPLQTLSATVQQSGTFSVRASTPLSTGIYTAQAEQMDAAGNIGRSSPNTFPLDAAADPVLLSAGDIAACDTLGDEATALLLDRLPGTVGTLGDHTYEYGTQAEFTNCYDPTWGRHKARTQPGVGDHEYNTPNATPYYNYFGAAAHDPSKGYYSYDLGTWHVVVLNGNCSEIGGCDAGSPEEQWLRADLAANPATCTVAYMGFSRFSSGSIHGSNYLMEDFWKALYDYGAELALGGDDHTYERFAPQTPTGSLDTARGIRQFVAGTGGRSHYAFGTIKPNTEVRNNDTFGILKLTLHPGTYDWQFVPEDGKTFTDSGTGACH